MTEATVPQVETSAALLRMTTDIVAAYVGRNVVPTADIAQLISAVHAALASAGQVPDASEPLKPAVPIKKSITPDYLICLEDGKKLKMLKRHLRSTYGMSPEDYRAKWGLPADYPMWPRAMRRRAASSPRRSAWDARPCPSRRRSPAARRRRREPFTHQPVT